MIILRAATAAACLLTLAAPTTPTSTSVVGGAPARTLTNAPAQAGAPNTASGLLAEPAPASGNMARAARTLRNGRSELIGDAAAWAPAAMRAEGRPNAFGQLGTAVPVARPGESLPEADGQGARVLPSGRDGYRQAGDYLVEMAELAREYPGTARLFSLAHTTWEGRQVGALEIARDVNLPDGRPTFLLLGLHHAREWPSGEVALEFAYDLLRSAEKDSRVNAILDRVRVVIVPVVNPDGFHVSRGLTFEDKRRNCRVPSGTCSQPSNFDAGVDLNRNYGVNWGGDRDPDSDTYAGPAAFSEPETRNVRDLVMSRQVTMLVTNHTYGNWLGHPKGPEEVAYKALGDRLAEQAGYATRTMTAGGLTERWSYYTTGGFGFMPEIGADEFHPRYQRGVVDQYLGTGGRAGLRGMYLLAAEAAADRAHHSVLTGKAPPGATLRLAKTVNAQLTSALRTVKPATGKLGAAARHRVGEAAGALLEDGGGRLESALVVPFGGEFVWDVNPSVRPIPAGLVDESWTLTCAPAGGSVTHTMQVLLRRGQQAQVDLSACARETVFADDFGSDRGWTVQPGTATTGQWEVGEPEPTVFNGQSYQLAAPPHDAECACSPTGVSERSANGTLVTGRLAGTDVGSHDVDGGNTRISSPAVALPDGTITMTFGYYLAHVSNASNEDYLQVLVNGVVVFEKRGSAVDTPAAWQVAAVDLSAYAGQTVTITVEAADAGPPSLVESALDDFRIERA